MVTARLQPAALAAAAALAFASTFATGLPSAAAFLVGVALLAVAARRRDPVLALATVLVVGAFQNLAAAALGGVLSPRGVLALLGAKELFVLTAAVTGLGLLRGRLGSLAADRAATLYLVVLLVPALPALADGSLASLASLRQAVLLPALWIAGRSCALDRAQADRLVRVLLRLGVAMAVFGLVERFVLGDAFWTWLGLPDVYRAKGLERFLFREGLPENFYSWDPGVRTRRLVGTLGEPTSFAHFLAIPVALTLGAALPGWLGAAGLLPLAALALTLGKSGAGTAFLGVAAARFLGSRRERLLVAGAGALLVAGAAVAWAVSPLLQDNVAAHTDGLVQVLSGAASLGGTGFGTAGNFAAVMHGDALPDRPLPAESFVAALVAQAGLLGLVAYLAFGAAAVAALLARRDGGAATRERAALAGVVAGTVIFSFASETPAGFLAGGVAFLVAGALAAPPRPHEELSPEVSAQPAPARLAG